MKKIYFIYVIAIILVLNSCNNSNNLPTIGIVQISDDPILDVARLSAIQSLKEAGLIYDQNIKIKYVSAQSELSNIPLILKSFENDKVKAILTVGTPCMMSAANMITKIPVVFTVSFSPEQMSIKAPENLYGYYDPLNVMPILELIKKIDTSIHTIGIPYNPGEPNAEYSAKKLIREAGNNNFHVFTQAVSNSNVITQNVQYLINKNIDALLISADNTMYQGLTYVASLAAKNKIPIFVTEPSQADNGAAIGLGISYQNWGKLSGEMLAQIIKGDKINDNKIRAFTDVELVVNKKLAQDQGLIIPQNIINKANKIITK